MLPVERGRQGHHPLRRGHQPAGLGGQPQLAQQAHRQAGILDGRRIVLRGMPRPVGGDEHLRGEPRVPVDQVHQRVEAGGMAVGRHLERRGGGIDDRTAGQGVELTLELRPAGDRAAVLGRSVEPDRTVARLAFTVLPLHGQEIQGDQRGIELLEDQPAGEFQRVHA